MLEIITFIQIVYLVFVFLLRSNACILCNNQYSLKSYDHNCSTSKITEILKAYEIMHIFIILPELSKKHMQVKLKEI